MTSAKAFISKIFNKDNVSQVNTENYILCLLIFGTFVNLENLKRQ